MHVDVLAIALTVLAFALLAGRLGGTPVTMPMIFTAAGALLGAHGLGVVDVGVDSAAVSVLAEVTLVVVLFTDASRMHLSTVVRDHSIALRLLLVGMPLAMVLGWLAGLVLLPDVPWLTVALVAVVLAPTDAALGQSFVTNEAVPLRIRQGLNVESGLNDGLALPFLLVVVDLARHDSGGPMGYVGLFAAMVGLGTLVGAATGWLGGRILERSSRQGWTTRTTQRIGTLSLAAVAYAGSEAVGGNGFVAAFVAGLTVGTTARSLLETTSVFAESEGQLLTLLTFLFFGAVVAGGLVDDAGWATLGYALVSLLVVRPLATTVALLGAGLSWPSVGFLGWAGPRGLASIVYAVLIVETGGVEGAEQLFTVAAWTILLSVLLHGASAAPLSRAYGRFVDARLPASSMERRPVSTLPVRLPPHRGRRAEEQA
ncbi:cation:proton antiporter [Nocardioides sp. SYSU DS0663]|uniref:cation:proton antiporter n=1 Tax=Nocardioides sp. SYSU DS0663 TaxID=3416445 RepID=UPI003F4CAA21